MALPLGVAAVVRGRGETDGMPGTFRLPTDSVASKLLECAAAEEAPSPSVCSRSCAAGPCDPNEATEATDIADRWDVVLNVRIWSSVRSPPMRNSSAPPCRTMGVERE